MPFEADYKDLIRRILHSGELRQNRTATPAISYFGPRIEYSVKDRFPIITGKFIDERIIKAEFNWFITGQTDIKLFAAEDIHIWDAWADKNGNLGPVYGYQMLQYNGTPHNQLQLTIDGLKSNPYGRRHIINLWNPLQLKDMALPPCYLYFQFYVNKRFGYLDMMVIQRSADVFGGLPYDMSLFGYFLIYMASKTNYKPRKIILNIGDAHIYENHLNQVDKYLKLKEYILPTWQFIDDKLYIQGYNHGPKLPIKIAV